MSVEGWKGWDEYAPFYDWENARTLGRRDVPFWRRLAGRAGGRVLELGCGTGRMSIPLARAGVPLVGIDRSAPMLERVEGRRRRARLALPLVRGDIRALPFATRAFEMVLAPYGVLQSLVRERDLTAALASVARVLGPGGVFGIDLVPDVPKWREYRDQVRFRGRTAGGTRLTLIESVRHNRRRQQTTFEQRYVERRGRQCAEHVFALTFRTLSVPQMSRRLAHAGFAIDRTYGDYRGSPWHQGAEVWLVVARRL